MKKVVSLYIKTESCDEYLDSVIDLEAEQIKEKLLSNIDMYCPICEYKLSYSYDDSVTSDEKCRYEKEVRNVLNDVYELSWNRDE